jgi:hypothetical protein
MLHLQASLSRSFARSLALFWRDILEYTIPLHRFEDDFRGILKRVVCWPHALLLGERFERPARSKPL